MHRLIALLLGCLLLGACETPRPFQPDKSRANETVVPPAPGVAPAARDRPEIAIARPAGMNPDNAERLARALTVELRRHDIVATTETQPGLPRLEATVTTAPYENGIEIGVRWKVLDRAGRTVDEFEHSTSGRAEDWERGSERMISRFAMRAAPEVAIRLGKAPAPPPPDQLSWSVLPGMPRTANEKPVPGGVPVIPDLPPITETPADAEKGRDPDKARDPAKSPTAAAQPIAAAQSRFAKVLVPPVSGAPGDGNSALTRAMRRALGTNRIILVDRPDAQSFRVIGAVSITAPQDGKQRIVIKWTVQDARGETVGDLQQANTIPAGALNGAWGGLADVISLAAIDAVLELIRRARAAGAG